MLFNNVADMLAIIIERAKFDGQIEGVVSHLVDEGLSILQYVDDTILSIIFFSEDTYKAWHIYFIICSVQLVMLFV
jgi:hypothetical protein